MNVPRLPSEPLYPAEWELFAAIIASGKTEREAYIKSSAGVALNCGLPSLLTAEALARIAWLREHPPIAGDPEYDPKNLTRDDIIRMLLSARINAREANNPNAEVKAVELLGKTLGVFEDVMRVDQEIKHRVIIVPAKSAAIEGQYTQVIPSPRSLALTRGGNGRAPGHVTNGRRDN